MKFENVIVTNPEKFESVKKRIVEDGPEKLHVVSDFDKTLTACFVKGKKIPSMISILRDEHYLTSDYSAKARALYDKYSKAESDLSIPFEERKRLMHEWWATHYELLVKSGLSKKDLESVVESENLSLRSGAAELLSFAHDRNVPFVIFSASGIGEAIPLCLKKVNKFYDNIFIASNKFVWGEDGRAIGVKEPIIHTFNKDYSSIRRAPFFKEIKDRKNVILLGDSPSDADMINGFDYENIIKIGFLNENEKGERVSYNSADQLPSSYIEVFDILILNDGPMDFVNLLLKELVAARE